MGLLDDGSILDEWSELESEKEPQNIEGRRKLNQAFSRLEKTHLLMKSKALFRWKMNTEVIRASQRFVLPKAEASVAIISVECQEPLAPLDPDFASRSEEKERLISRKYSTDSISSIKSNEEVKVLLIDMKGNRALINSCFQLAKMQLRILGYIENKFDVYRKRSAFAQWRGKTTDGMLKERENVVQEKPSSSLFQFSNLRNLDFRSEIRAFLEGRRGASRSCYLGTIEEVSEKEALENPGAASSRSRRKHRTSRKLTVDELDDLDDLSEASAELDMKKEMKLAQSYSNYEKEPFPERRAGWRVACGCSRMLRFFRSRGSRSAASTGTQSVGGRGSAWT